MICECCGQFKKIEIHQESFSIIQNNEEHVRVIGPTFCDQRFILDLNPEKAHSLRAILHEWESRLGKVAP